MTAHTTIFIKRRDLISCRHTLDSGFSRLNDISQLKDCREVLLLDEPGIHQFPFLLGIFELDLRSQSVFTLPYHEEPHTSKRLSMLGTSL